MTEKYRSQTIRKGEPESHKAAANAVVKAIEDDYLVDRVEQRKEVVFSDGYHHQYDIAVYGITHFIEVGDVGDDSKHNLGHKQQMINDGVAKAHVEKDFPNAKYIKINKDDAFYPDWVKKKIR